MKDGTSRGLLTDRDREIFQEKWEGKSRQEKQPLYNARSKVRSRTEQLATDLRLLQHETKGLFNEIITQLDGIEWADPNTQYCGKNQDGNKIVLADDEPIQSRQDITDLTEEKPDKITYGDRSTSSLHCAIALLAHATDPDIAQRLAKEFATACVYSLTDEWNLTANEIQQWVRTVENERQDDIHLRHLNESPYQEKKRQMSKIFESQTDSSISEFRNIEEKELKAAALELFDEQNSTVSVLFKEPIPNDGEPTNWVQIENFELEDEFAHLTLIGDKKIKVIQDQIEYPPIEELNNKFNKDSNK